MLAGQHASTLVFRQTIEMSLISNAMVTCRTKIRVQGPLSSETCRTLSCMSPLACRHCSYSRLETPFLDALLFIPPLLCSCDGRRRAMISRRAAASPPSSSVSAREGYGSFLFPLPGWAGSARTGSELPFVRQIDPSAGAGMPTPARSGA